MTKHCLGRFTLCLFKLQMLLFHFFNSNFKRKCSFTQYWILIFWVSPAQLPDCLIKRTQRRVRIVAVCCINCGKLSNKKNKNKNNNESNKSTTRIEVHVGSKHIQSKYKLNSVIWRHFYSIIWCFMFTYYLENFHHSSHHSQDFRWERRKSTNLWSTMVLNLLNQQVLCYHK